MSKATRAMEEEIMNGATVRVPQDNEELLALRRMVKALVTKVESQADLLADASRRLSVSQVESAGLRKKIFILEERCERQEVEIVECRKRKRKNP